MACQVQITSVSPYGTPGQGLSSLVVTGTASECPGNAVVVEVDCGGTPKTQSVAVTQGAWQATFADLSGTGCVCNDPTLQLVVKAYCKAVTTCSDRVAQPILCQPYPCPTIDHIGITVPSCAQVMQAGVWNVTFTAVINGSGVTNYAWSFGDSGTDEGANLQQVTHPYKCAGEYSVTLVITSDCAPPDNLDIKTATLDLATCGCPTISSIEAHQDPTNPCHWTFKAKIGSPFTDCIDQYLWDFGDGHQDHFTEEADHTYSGNGDYTVTLTLEGDGIGQPDGGPCFAKLPIKVRGCRGNDNDHKPCPWWNPFCKGWNLCAVLYALALASILGGAVAVMVAACVPPPPVSLVAVLLVAAASLATAIVFLSAWYAVCRKLDVSFCDTLDQLIQVVFVLVFVQAFLTLILSFLTSVYCAAGAAFAVGYFGAVLVYLLQIRHMADCPGSPPTHLPWIL